jgi:hypothetical protein
MMASFIKLHNNAMRVPRRVFQLREKLTGDNSNGGLAIKERKELGLCETNGP